VPTLSLTTISSPQKSDRTDRLAREWVVTFAELYRVSLKERGPRFVDLWVFALSDLEPAVLDAACKRAMQTCKFFPTPAEIREHIDRTKEIALAEAADLEWQKVLDLRRVYWNPDIAGGFSRGMPKLSARVAAAARAAGVFREVSDSKQLHVWGKNRFIESYLAWEALEQDQFLLPDGELKDALTGAARKLLPSPVDEYPAARAVGEKYRDKMSAMTAMVASMTGRPAPPRPIVVPQSRWELLQKQRAELLAKSTPEQIREAERLRSL
jgi:hypothetical protein